MSAAAVLDLTKAARAGLVMNETFANFLAANPDTGGDPETLNIPSVRNMNCTPSCTWTRTVRNTRNVPSNWKALGVSSTPGLRSPSRRLTSASRAARQRHGS